MSIRKQVEWTGTKFTGYVDIGANIDSDMLPEAREAIVFMLYFDKVKLYIKELSLNSTPVLSSLRKKMHNMLKMSGTNGQ
ncbi:hypothetical protein D910_06264 [Dendroctonus ponderosae]|uniref:Transposable element P transposase-like RNase H domain-containing protein n=1 Tax=Dendroctonus ponderosae TaxID=77166 RepID=U4U765_DENPD|nr:hypothetical protein D910_06264 [Dendroctonus ponderosae]